MRRNARHAWLALLAWAAAPDIAQAHAPLSRDVAVGPRGALAVRMPGFGIVLRANDAAPFAYACDALLGLTPVDDPIAWAYRPDGALLLASTHGLALVSADGCGHDMVRDIGAVPVVALALSASRSVAYAVAEGAAPGLYRSSDGGERWERRGVLPAASGESALRIDADDADTIFVSRATAPGNSVVLRSSDGGATFMATQHDRELALLHVEPGASGRLWASARTGKGMETAVLTADKDGVVWTEHHRVRFFGGFAAAPDGREFWVGDEAGGVFRSTDGGAHFDALAPTLAVACLLHADDALWACTQGTTTQQAVAVSSDAGAHFEAVVAFADVEDAVACPMASLASEMCAPAWTEWHGDVLGMGLVTTPPSDDAGLVSAQDAGAEASDASGAAPHTGAASSEGGGCGVAASLGSRRSHAAAAVLWALCLARLRRASGGSRRRGLGRCAPPAQP